MKGRPSAVAEYSSTVGSPFPARMSWPTLKCTHRSLVVARVQKESPAQTQNTAQATLEMRRFGTSSACSRESQSM